MGTRKGPGLSLYSHNSITLTKMLKCSVKKWNMISQGLVIRSGVHMQSRECPIVDC